MVGLTAWLGGSCVLAPAQPAPALPAQHAQMVAVPTAGLSSAPQPLGAMVFNPAGEGSHPAVVMLHGGGVTLDTISHPPEKHLAAAGGFRAAVSFYPGCTARSKRADTFHPYAPLLLLIGESDDWTPAAPCKALAASVAVRGEPMQIVSYPDTYHDFDNPALTTKRVRADVPNGVTPGAGVTVAPNPAAREDAKLRVQAFLSEHLR